jgi:hypothetical protein
MKRKCPAHLGEAGLRLRPRVFTAESMAWIALVKSSTAATFFAFGFVMVAGAK